jgi:hypothetical protein
MKLIWTYDNRIKLSYINSERRLIMEEFYKKSINAAKTLGYYTIIYTNSESEIIFKNLVDEIVIVDTYDNTLIFDYLKIKVLEDRDDEFCLIDGDLILHSRLPIFTEDIVFDTYEKNSWKHDYKFGVEKITNSNIIDIISYWTGKRISIFNCGLLYIKYKKHRIKYVNDWKQLSNWIIKFENEFNMDLRVGVTLISQFTCIISQYLLTIFANENKLNTRALNNKMGETGKYYKHYYGGTKYHNNQFLIDNNKKSII